MVIRPQPEGRSVVLCGATVEYFDVKIFFSGWLSFRWEESTSVELNLI